MKESRNQCSHFLSFHQVVYVGSRFGDSQLIRLSPQHNELGSYINLLDSYPNIGPIRLVDTLIVKYCEV